MATHSSILTWKIPWTEEPDGLQSVGSLRVRHNRATKPSPPRQVLELMPFGYQGTTVTLMSSYTQRHGNQHPSWPVLEPESRLHLLGKVFLIYCLFSNFESASEVAQSCPTLGDPMDCSPPGSSVHGIFQARILEWVAISFSRGSSLSRDRTRVSRIAGRGFTI